MTEGPPDAFFRTRDEWRQLLRQCVDLQRSRALLTHSLSRMNSRVSRRLLPPLVRYPRPVRAALGAPPRPAPVPTGLRTLDAPGSVRMRLINRSVQLPGLHTRDLGFDDPEETFFFHRWNWLLADLSPHEPPPLEWGLTLMRGWLAAYGDDRNGDAWTSYTTGERICNAILFATLAARRQEVVTPPPDVAWHLSDMAAFLSRRIEYNGSLATGNHVINNARALYFAGQALGLPGRTRLALAILESQLPVVVTSDGFLREGSSHYHFLVTRWLLEVLWLAELTGEASARALVEPVAARMVAQCQFFLVFNPQSGAWSVPLIGDVSPDCSVAWLIDLPWSAVATRIRQGEPLVGRRPPGGWGALMDAVTPW